MSHPRMVDDSMKIRAILHFVISVVGDKFLAKMSEKKKTDVSRIRTYALKEEQISNLSP